MTDFASILTVVLPVYLTMGAGAAARHAGILPKEADAGLMKLAVTLLTPCLILGRVVGNASVMQPLPVLLAAGLGYALVALGIAVSYFAAPLIGLKKHEGRRTFAVSCGLQNYGFVAIPIVTALFPDSGTLGVLRHDYPLAAWGARPADAEPPFSSWRTVFAAVEVEEKADPMKREDPESLLRRLVEEDENHAENVRYILAVMLERQNQREVSLLLTLGARPPQDSTPDAAPAPEPTAEPDTTAAPTPDTVSSAEPDTAPDSCCSGFGEPECGR